MIRNYKMKHLKVQYLVQKHLLLIKIHFNVFNHQNLTVFLMIYTKKFMKILGNQITLAKQELMV